ncbi:hypothetical protein [Hydrotalea sp.]|uniref:hypothetical protein n=1 Tax=Hydrotalea sp. TaxID=2881279 RepID=UPI0026191C2C|nr:hypothetical protein [Hydrotalea sp.]
MQLKVYRGIVPAIFFGNYFYGICVVALSIETAFQLNVPLNPWPYYMLIFAATVVYYTKAYLIENLEDSANKRAHWYVKHHQWVWVSQISLSFISLFCLFLLFKNSWQHIFNMTAAEWLLWLSVPIVAGLYYGIGFANFTHFNLRNTGWLKPFVIGFVWAATITIYPILYRSMTGHIVFQLNSFDVMFFIKNFMYITVLCIMFDIKDYATDYNQQLKTFVVRVGLRKTIFYILIPLCAIGFGTFLVYTISHHFSAVRILLNAIPFILILSVAYSMHKRQNIMYYLIIIDGLMLVKASCGILSTLF